MWKRDGDDDGDGNGDGDGNDDGAEAETTSRPKQPLNCTTFARTDMVMAMIMVMVMVMVVDDVRMDVCGWMEGGPLGCTFGK